MTTVLNACSVSKQRKHVNSLQRTAVSRTALPLLHPSPNPTHTPIGPSHTSFPYWDEHSIAKVLEVLAENKLTAAEHSLPLARSGGGFRSEKVKTAKNSKTKSANSGEMQ